MPKARAKTPPNSFEPCTECQRFKSRATVFTGWRMLFPERPSPIELRRKVSQELGSLRGRGGRRKELERQTGRQTAGRPTKPVDPWLADRAEASIEAWIGSHAPGVLNREHLDRNGFAALEQKHFRGTARQVARRIVAQAFGVSVRTLTRRRTAKLIDVCEEEGELRIDALERLHDPQAADVHAKITGGSEGARILTAYVDVANDEGRRLRLTIFKCPPGYSAKRGHP